ncbi:uncharacterized protein LOC130682571 [Manis pentadactyla]|uniref:uncharacterized protein LOC130682571 n=1 Tax=Manis pentadactyla TaxID=143292 RepID=UPI00255C6A96|nr:uncharacterized protein LOC130682571 [Manis pentadactyla]
MGRRSTTFPQTPGACNGGGGPLKTWPPCVCLSCLPTALSVAPAPRNPGPEALPSLSSGQSTKGCPARPELALLRDFLCPRKPPALRARLQAVPPWGHKPCHGVRGFYLPGYFIHFPDNHTARAEDAIWRWQAWPSLQCCTLHSPKGALLHISHPVRCKEEYETTNQGRPAPIGGGLLLSLLSPTCCTAGPQHPEAWFTWLEYFIRLYSDCLPTALAENKGGAMYIWIPREGVSCPGPRLSTGQERPPKDRGSSCSLTHESGVWANPSLRNCFKKQKKPPPSQGLMLQGLTASLAFGSCVFPSFWPLVLWVTVRELPNPKLSKALS